MEGGVEQSQAEEPQELLLQVFQKLLEGIKKEGGAISDEQLKALESLFPHHLLAALDLVERGAVTKYTCTCSNGERTLYTVQGNSGHMYTCLGSSRYCSCPSFVYHVLGKRDMLLCKHQLATCMAVAMEGQNTCRHVHVSEEDWAQMAAQQRPS